MKNSSRKIAFLFFLTSLFSLASFLILIFLNGKSAGGAEKIQAINTSAQTSDLEIDDAGSATIIFGGDIMFDRYIRTLAERKRSYDFIFENIKAVLGDADLAVANLEGPITDNASISQASKMGERNNYYFTFTPETAEVLFRNNLKLVSLGNNHILNFENDGLEQTKRNLTTAGVEYLGDPFDQRGIIKEIGSLRLGFVNYNQFASGSEASAKVEISRLDSLVDLVIVYTHWGKEYEPKSLPSTQKLAHEFIDLGADAIIGSHPHVIQEKEEYKGKIIYYSLGNFVFDQYLQEETKRGLLVKMVIEDGGQSIIFKEAPIVIGKNGIVSLSSEK